MKRSKRKKPNPVARMFMRLAQFFQLLALYIAGYRRSKKLTSWHWMRKMRNRPCVCGSGKKFKRCCLKRYEKIQNREAGRKV